MLKFFLGSPSRTRTLLFTSILACFALSLSGCGKKKSKVKFKYDEVSGLCKDKDGVVGRNEGMVECGNVLGEVTDYKDYSGKALAGLKVLDSEIEFANFNNADLRGASFTDTSLYGSTFQGTKLQATRFEISRRDFGHIYSSDFQGAIVDDDTRLPLGSDIDLMKILEAGAIFAPAQDGSLLTSASGPALEALNKSEKLIVAQTLRRMESILTPSIATHASMTQFFESDARFRTPLDYIASRVKFVLPVDRSSASKNAIAYNGSGIFFFQTWQDAEKRYADSLNDLVSSVNRWSVSIDTTATPSVLTAPEFTSKDLFQGVIGASSTSVGVIGIEPAFGQVGGIKRIGTMLHEARHTDCHLSERNEKAIADLKNLRDSIISETAGLNRLGTLQLKDRRNSINEINERLEKVKTLTKSYESKKSQAFHTYNNDPSCHHTHVKCPSWHDLAGADACDSGIEWGAYYVGGSANAAIANCTSCTEAQKDEALMAGLDGYNRVLDLDEKRSSWGAPRFGELTTKDFGER